ncbi:MAG TPA: PIN domain-containing protein, partial [Planctomycetota bacterium]|nr:PIN domain-containing protein [Planctomycetota bacterium]
PFIEFRREGGPGGKPLILDTSAIIDGRIADVLDQHAFDGRIVIPKFVLLELQSVADSPDRLKRMRGRRGLDILNRIRTDHDGRVTIQDATLPDIEGVDAKLVKLAKLIEARLLTLDFNLNKVAQVQGVEVINLNDLATALRPPLLQGEKLIVRIVKPGESPGQGVGYLEDGTMVVGEDCASRIGQEAELVVSNILQTSAGRMIFGKPALKGGEASPSGPTPREEPASR